ncbi:class II aldolase/adducin family protein [Winogradskya humida]|uniref:Fructose-bisphosphate aldolase n=1 Tax=Winogradskya humida TaxID=113566 RepID=A0ABQ3ZN07_9ACTN|nr:class II aldolase/adducin family protein [Actinoplanes humidus]GIE19971.1 fructose-bisphosphate aldolase [Actinoplanes humidus]
MNYVPGDLRDQLAHVGYDVVQAGLACGAGGNLSARIAAADVCDDVGDGFSEDVGFSEDGGGACWVTGRGSWLERLSRSTFTAVRIFDGSPATLRKVTPPRLEPSGELALHLALYRTRPDVQAIVHVHAPMTLLLDALGERIRLVTTDHADHLRRIATVPFREPGGTEVAAVAAAMAADGTNCLVLSQHGFVVLADSVELAHKRARNLEEAARLTYQALTVGRLGSVREVSGEFLDRLAEKTPIAV